MATLACEYRCNEKAVVVMTLLPRPFRVSLRTAKCCNEIVFITLSAAYSELCCALLKTKRQSQSIQWLYWDWKMS